MIIRNPCSNFPDVERDTALNSEKGVEPCQKMPEKGHGGPRKR